MRPVGAYSMAEPEKHRVYSPNQEYFLVVNPRTYKHAVYRSGFHLWPIWSFRQKIQFDSFYLSDDGESVAVVAWAFVQKNDTSKGAAVSIWHRNGKKCVFSFSDLSRPRPYRRGEIGPIGSFWRIWLEQQEQAPDGIRLLTAGRDWLFINFQTCVISSTGSSPATP